MNNALAKQEANIALRGFVGKEITTEVLNDIENTVNGLIEKWHREHGFRVYTRFGPRGGTSRGQYAITGVKVKRSDFSEVIEFSFRYE